MGQRSQFDDEPTPALPAPGMRSAQRRRGCLVVLSGPRIGELFSVEEEANGFLIGRDAICNLTLLDDGVSRRHALLEVAVDGVSIRDLDSTNGTFVNGARLEGPIRLGEGDRIQIGQASSIRFARFDPIEEECQRQLLEAALRDALTRAFNRRYLVERLTAEVAYSERHHKPLSVLLVDLDNFKQVNDTLGHVAGDTVLRRVSELMHRAMRVDDVLTRYGGDEFCVVARDTGHDGGMRLAERLRGALSRSQVEHGRAALASGAEGHSFDPVTRTKISLIRADFAALPHPRGCPS